MTRFTLTLLAGALAGQSAADEPSDAEAFLAKVDAVTRGDWTEGRRRVVMKGTLAMPAMEHAGTFTEVYDGAERVKFTISYPGLGETTMGTTGEMSWSTDPAVGITIREGDEQGAVRRMFAVGARSAGAELYEAIETMLPVEYDGRPHFELTMRPAHGQVEGWTVDAETKTLSRLSTALPDPNGGELPMAFLYRDYRVVDGVLYPFEKVQVVGAYEITFQYRTIVHLPSLGDADLAPPADVLEAWKNPDARAPVASDEMHVREFAEQHVASVRMKVDMTEIARSLAIMLPEVMTHLTRTGVVPAGAPFSRYHSIEGTTVDLEAGIPVATPIQDAGRVKASTLPGGKTAVAWHVGGYHELPTTYAALGAWIEAQKLEKRAPYWEIYWTDPGLEPDMSNWRTEVLWPVK